VTEVRWLMCKYDRLTPGPVRTDLTRRFNMGDMPSERLAAFLKNMNPVEDVCEGLMKCIDTGSVGTTNGGFRDWKGDTIPW
jgi:hypothetical protein